MHVQHKCSQRTTAACHTAHFGFRYYWLVSDMAAGLLAALLLPLLNVLLPPMACEGVDAAVLSARECDANEGGAGAGHQPQAQPSQRAASPVRSRPSAPMVWPRSVASE